MEGNSISLDKSTDINDAYRWVIKTTDLMQLVLMSLKKGQTIPRELHESTDQFIKVEMGECIITIDDKAHNIKQGDAIIIPHGNYHEVVAIKDTKLYTIYTPPIHEDGLMELYP